LKDIKESNEYVSLLKGITLAPVNYDEAIKVLDEVIKKDPTFQHTILVGTGGIYTEAFNDKSLRIAPITKSQAKQMLQELKIYEILEGKRNQKYNLEKLTDIIVKLSKLPLKHKNLSELDINPLILDDKDAIIVDARISFE